MKASHFLSFVTLTLAISLNAFAAPSTIEEVRAQIKSSGFNGVAYLSKGDQVIFREAFGYRNRSSKAALRPDDIFQIGSNTKQFVAAAILKLQEEGKLSTDDYITRYLPQYTKFNDIKIKDVLNHTSGIKDYSNTGFMSTRSPKKIHTLTEIINYCHKLNLDFEPRSAYKYSNSGYVIAGKIIEVVSGQSWHSYIDQQFLQPLGMTNSGHESFFEKISPVIGHRYKNGSFSQVHGLNLSWALSAGSIHSNVDDMAKWLNIHGDSDLLSRSSKAEMHKPFLVNYGLGVNTNAYGNDHLISHTGITRGFYSRTFYLKKSKIKVITLDNSDGVARGTAEMLLKFAYSNYKSNSSYSDRDNRNDSNDGNRESLIQRFKSRFKR